MGKPRSSSTQSGRLVRNHSTNIPGLIPVLTRLAEQPEIKTVTPGRLARAKGRPLPLRIKVSVPITGGHKLQARSKGNVQEVFVITDLSAQDLQVMVDGLQVK
jgi:hypothetical protein